MMKYLIIVLLVINSISVFAQQKLKGKFIPEHQLFLTEKEDSIYLVGHFKDGFGVFFLKSDMTLAKLLDNKYELREFDKTGLIDSKGNIVLERSHNWIVIYDEHFARVKNGKKYRLYDLKLKKFISKEYDLISKVESGIFEVEIGEFHGLIDSEGKEFIPLQYTNSLSWEFQDFIAVRKNGKFGALTKDGKQILPFHFDYVSGIYDQIIAKERTGYSIYNTNGEKLSDRKFERVQAFLNRDLLPIKEGEKFYAFDLRQNKIVSQGYDEILSLSNDPKDFFRTYDQDMFGVIDSKYQTVLEPVYEMGSFTNGFATIGKDEKFGYLNENFEIIIPLQYDFVSSFLDEMAFVQSKGRFGFINTKGEFIFEVPYKNVGSFFNGLARKKENNLYGFVDKTGMDVIPVQFEWADNFQHNSALVLKNGAIYFINKEGKRIK